MRRNILITGASSGLGAEMARQFAAKGHDLALTARRTERLEALRTELAERHPQITVVIHSLDVTDHDQVFKVFRAAKLEDRLPLATNLIVSNVPGPPVQLYMAGARIEHIFPVGPLTVGMGMNVTVFSYGKFVDVGIQTDPNLVEDPWELLGEVTDELAQLVAATN